MKKLLTLLTFMAVCIMMQAQTKVGRASLNEDGQVQYQEFTIPETLQSTRDELPQMPGFPVTIGSNMYYKPFRGIALADIDGIAGDEIIVNHDDSLTVIKGDGTILWARQITGGYAQYAPSVGDINNDGFPEIIATAMYANSYGGLNVFDKDGNQLEGFPVQTANNPVICAAALADINNDGFLEIIWNGKGRSSQNVSSGIHVWNYLAQEIEGFPAEMPSTPATTPTIADIDGDGNLEIFATTTSALYAFNNQGEMLPNYPIESNEAYKYSYQSPLIVKFADNEDYSLVGACHGDNPNHYVRNAVTGEYRQGWPKSTGNWTYTPPTVVDLNDNGDYTILAGVAAQAMANVMYRYDTEGNVMQGFPVSRETGAEGFIAVADIDGDGEPEFLTESNGVAEYNGVNRGYIYAYEMDGTEITEGFPLRPQGYTFMNGANIGDVMGDGNMYLVALTYDNNFVDTDPAYINVYPLNQPIDNLMFGTYKGDNTRTGFMNKETQTICNPPQNLHEGPYPLYLDEVYIAIEWEEQQPGSTGTFLGYNIYRDNEKINTEYVEELWYFDENVTLGEVYNYCVSAVYDNCEAFSDTIQVEAWDVSVNEIKENKISVYPNPVENQCNIICNSVILSIELFNLQGQLLNNYEGNNQNSMILNINELKGVYFLRINTQLGNSFVKLTIK